MEYAALGTLSGTVGMPTPVSLNQITMAIGDTGILQNVSLDLRQGSVTALVGPSGSGKSSLLRVVNRMWDHVPRVRVTGAVYYDGRNIYDRAVDVNWLRSRIGMVFQQPTPFPRSISENIALPLRVQGTPRTEIADRVEEALRQAALWDEVRHRLREPALSLSGGQQQRLCIARALAVNPDVLLMDEPASALDRQSRRAIDDLIVSFKHRLTVLLVTHHLDEAEAVSDFAAVMIKGRVAASGPTAEVFHGAADPAVQAYLEGGE